MFQNNGIIKTASEQSNLLLIDCKEPARNESYFWSESNVMKSINNQPVLRV